MDRLPVVHVINLSSAVARRRDISSQLSALGLAFQMMPAVDGRAGEHLRFANLARSYRYGLPLSVGQIGCFASHYLLWQKAVETGRPLVVLEDDAILDPRFGDAVRAVAPLIGAYPYIRLQATQVRPAAFLREAGGGYRLVRYPKGPTGTVAYAIAPAGAAALIAGAKKWREPVDDYMDRYWVHGVDCLGLMPYRVSFDPKAPSDIAADPFLRWRLERRRFQRWGEGVFRILYNLRP